MGQGLFGSIFCSVLFLMVVACGATGSSYSSGDGNGDGAKPTPDPDLHFANVTTEVFSVRCYQCHHRGEGRVNGDLGVDTYDEVKNNANRIYQAAIVQKRMPLGGPPLTERQYNLLKAWLEAGTPLQTELEFLYYEF